MSGSRIAALDGLRGVAILIVVGSHAVTGLFPGTLGVTLFFFISGFIITQLLLDSDSDRLAPFYVRRFFRLAPTLLTYIAVCCLCLTLLGGRVSVSDVLASVFYYANYHDFSMPALKVTWSLAVEEHFYILYPVVLISLRHRTDRLQAVLITCLVVCLLWRFALVGIGVHEFRTQKGTDTRLDSLAYGCLLSVLFHRAPQVEKCRRFLEILSGRRALLIGGLLLLGSLAIRDNVFRQTLRFTLQGMSFAPLFCALFWSKSAPALITRTLESRSLTYIGAVSYSLYLYHELGLMFSNHFVVNKVANSVSALAIGFAATLISYYLVETPGRRTGTRLAQRIRMRSDAALARAPKSA